MTNFHKNHEAVKRQMTQVKEIEQAAESDSDITEMLELLD